MKSKRYDPGYHLELAARAQLLGVREGDPDETHTLLHGFVEEVGSGSRVEAETLDLIAWMIGRVLDGVDPAQVFSAPAREKDGGRTARQQLQKRRRERMIRLAAQDVRLELEQGGDGNGDPAVCRALKAAQSSDTCRHGGGPAGLNDRWQSRRSRRG